MKLRLGLASVCIFVLIASGCTVVSTEPASPGEPTQSELEDYTRDVEIDEESESPGKLEQSGPEECQFDELYFAYPSELSGISEEANVYVWGRIPEEACGPIVIESLLGGYGAGIETVSDSDGWFFTSLPIESLPELVPGKVLDFSLYTSLPSGVQSALEYRIPVVSEDELLQEITVSDEFLEIAGAVELPETMLTFEEVVYGPAAEFPSLDPKVCCAIVEWGSRKTYWATLSTCEGVVEDDQCLPQEEPLCCCVPDDGPGTIGEWLKSSQCTQPVCLPGVPPDPSNPGLCAIPNYTAPTPDIRLRPRPEIEGAAERLRGLNSQYGSSSSALCKAPDPGEPQRPCYDVIRCGVDTQTKNVTCRACSGKDCVLVSPPGMFRNIYSIYLAQYNQNDLQAKWLYVLDGSNTEVYKRLVILFNALFHDKNRNYTTDMLTRHALITSVGPTSCQAMIYFNGNPQLTPVDCFLLQYSESMDSDLFMFERTAGYMKDVAFSHLVYRFIDDARLYVGNFLVQPYGNTGAISQRQLELTRIRDYLVNDIQNYVNQHP